jgi:hypothetical protein
VARSVQHGSENSGPSKGGPFIEQRRHLIASEVTKYSLG